MIFCVICVYVHFLLAIIWYNQQSVHEVSVNGRKQGTTIKGRSSVKSRCSICKVALYERFKELLVKYNHIHPFPQLSRDTQTYRESKEHSSTYKQARQRFLEVLSSWITNPIEYESFG
jgi:hypothetical protein